jgi:hypothetical protein
MSDPGQEREAQERACRAADLPTWLASVSPESSLRIGWRAGRAFEAALVAREEPQGEVELANARTQGRVEIDRLTTELADARAELAAREDTERPDMPAWRCPDCGSGVTKVHVGTTGLMPCGKPPGYWTREDTERPDGASLIAVERERQVSEEGWTAEHDAQHTLGELRMAAKAYASDPSVDSVSPVYWPWNGTAWKPSEMAAEIDRLQRARDTEREHKP